MFMSQIKAGVIGGGGCVCVGWCSVCECLEGIFVRKCLLVLLLLVFSLGYCGGSDVGWSVSVRNYSLRFVWNKIQGLGSM